MRHPATDTQPIARQREVPFDVSVLVEDLSRLAARALVGDITVKPRIDPGLYVRGQGLALLQALLGLCIAASDAIGGRGVLALSVRRSGSDDSGRQHGEVAPEALIEIRVEADGVAVDPEPLRRIVEPAAMGDGTSPRDGARARRAHRAPA